ncbi:hypothetical protein SBRY_40467 [Actinacidiphila bryophytorum]|uniref:Uncharacterized protein n=1 Tax=Actinacidiphila bryophytorum TaxID=1436133 RepID=A0A9W4H332_9ACTN|nr:hypothetical protein SBRY_40467 [Actinacidiphila bryophytorum]
MALPRRGHRRHLSRGRRRPRGGRRRSRPGRPPHRRPLLRMGQPAGRQHARLAADRLTLPPAFANRPARHIRRRRITPHSPRTDP